jgi:formylglycine-generating enzyme required for sulfatase activity
MRIVLCVTVLVLAAGVSPAEEPPATDVPEGHVRALRYRVFVSGSFFEFNHGSGGWIDEIWLPDYGVAANLVNDFTVHNDLLVDRPIANAFYAEKPRNESREGLRSADAEQPVVEWSIPAELAERIRALADLKKRWEEEREALGAALSQADAVALRLEEETRQSGNAVFRRDVEEVLEGWAEVLGEHDHEWSFPLRVRRTIDGAEMVLVPDGTLRQGHAARDGESGIGLEPSRPVVLSRSYYVDVAEVTVGMWRRYAAATGATVPAVARDDAHDLPIRGVTHAAATAYADWAGCTLPTEAQWERAARAGRAYALFPTDVRRDVVAQRNGSGADDGFGAIAPVRSFPANPWGLFDLAGNVAEWCADGYAPVEAASVPVRDPIGPPDAPRRVIKGGSWHDAGSALSIGARAHAPSDASREDVGFRCVRVLPAER